MAKIELCQFEIIIFVKDFVVLLRFAVTAHARATMDRATARSPSLAEEPEGEGARERWADAAGVAGAAAAAALAGGATFDCPVALRMQTEARWPVFWQ